MSFSNGQTSNAPSWTASVSSVCQLTNSPGKSGCDRQNNNYSSNADARIKSLTGDGTDTLTYTWGHTMSNAKYANGQQFTLYTVVTCEHGVTYTHGSKPWNIVNYFN